MQRTMHRVLAIPELLDTIFRLLNPDSNLNNALVCKNWSEIALDTLWREVNDLRRLFTLLAPLGKANSGDLEFTRIPEPNDWKRFQKYAKRVRVLKYDDGRAEHALSHSVFDDIARTRTVLNILPNMHTLDWKASLPLCVMFMHSNVKHFIIHLPNNLKSNSPRPFFDDIITRMPFITYLDIRTTVPMHAIEEDTLVLLSTLTKLQKVIFPRYYYTEKIAGCLSRLPELGCIEFQYFEEQGYGDSLDTVSFKPSFLEGAYPALSDLSMAVNFQDTRRFLTIPFAPANLTILYIDSQILETPETIRGLLAAIAESCQLLRVLTLISPRQREEPETMVNGVTMRIGMDTLKPLFSCPNLTSLEIIHQYPVNISQNDLEFLAPRWPSLETLILNNEPFYLEKSDLTLEALLPFARHCSKLRHLGLFLDASTRRIPPFIRDPLSPSFTHLERLSMGLSVIDDDQPVALFLSNVIPLGCQIDSGVTCDESYQALPGTALTISVRFELWAMVNNLMPVLTNVRLEEREKTKELKRELDDLRMRTQVLSEKFGNIKGSGDACIIS